MIYIPIFYSDKGSIYPLFTYIYSSIYIFLTLIQLSIVPLTIYLPFVFYLSFFPSFSINLSLLRPLSIFFSFVLYLSFSSSFSIFLSLQRSLSIFPAFVLYLSISPSFSIYLSSIYLSFLLSR